jgi:hypothetical protein
MFLATLAPFLLFAAFVLLLLVSLSAPIIDSIYLFRLSATTAGAQSNVNFGVWGYCAGAVKTACVPSSLFTTRTYLTDPRM